MSDDKPAAPPAFAPRSAAPRPDAQRSDVPPPPPASVATDVRVADEPAVRRPDDATTAIEALRKAARNVTSVVSGEAPSAPAVDAPVPSAPAPAGYYAPQPLQGGQPVGGTPHPDEPSAPASAPGAHGPAHNAAGAPRRVRLVVSRVNPWSVMKMAFLLSIALGVITVVAAAVVWSVLNGMHLFSSINDLVEKVVGNETQVNVLQYVAFSRTMSMATLISVVNIVLVTALATIGAFLYNIASALVGGVHVTLTDD